MKRTAVRSKDIAIIGYDPTSSLLEVAFRHGGVYEYQGVPAPVYEGLMAAPSHGTYFNQKIKDQYPTLKKA